ncbi:5'-methylthioadenosine nucleosidase [bacterium]|nr:5'-methylthioadenosine nucleosidase [bacterium]MDB4128634.1 5'-methylthioadenosine nucleosidase [bacterium]MDC1257264.1 5'-methylthioadenosine nucleosidase [bacterium]
MIYILIALPEEFPQEYRDQIDSEKYQIVFTGIGKVNATMACMKVIHEHTPSNIINYGTAGSLNPVFDHGVYKVARVAQRDLDIRALGMQLGQAGFNDDVWISLDDVENRPTLTTGDNFVDSLPELESDLVDMEAAAYAKVCQAHGVSLDVYKFISDNADGEAAGTWEENCHKGSKMFVDILKGR